MFCLSTASRLALLPRPASNMEHEGVLVDGIAGNMNMSSPSIEVKLSNGPTLTSLPAEIIAHILFFVLSTPMPHFSHDLGGDNLCSCTSTLTATKDMHDARLRLLLIAPRISQVAISTPSLWTDIAMVLRWSRTVEDSKIKADVERFGSYATRSGALDIHLAVHIHRTVEDLSRVGLTDHHTGRLLPSGLTNHPYSAVIQVLKQMAHRIVSLTLVLQNTPSWRLFLQTFSSIPLSKLQTLVIEGSPDEKSEMFPYAEATLCDFVRGETMPMLTEVKVNGILMFTLDGWRQHEAQLPPAPSRYPLRSLTMTNTPEISIEIYQVLFKSLHKTFGRASSHLELVESLRFQFPFPQSLLTAEPEFEKLHFRNMVNVVATARNSDRREYSCVKTLEIHDQNPYGFNLGMTLRLLRLPTLEHLRLVQILPFGVHRGELIESFAYLPDFLSISKPPLRKFEVVGLSLTQAQMADCLKTIRRTVEEVTVDRDMAPIALDAGLTFSSFGVGEEGQEIAHLRGGRC